MNHRRPALALIAAGALIAPGTASLAADPPRPEVAEQAHRDGERELARAVTEAATEARQQRGKESAPGQAKKQVAKALDEAASALIDDGAVGVTARVDAPGHSWRGADGSRELNHRPPAHPQDRFRVASITKTMVATMVMQEVENGTFTLDTPVNDLIPGLFPGQPDVTVEHLLSHRSGAQTGTELSILAHMQDPTSLTEFLAALGADYSDESHLDAVNAAPWLFEPGTDYSYSNAGYIALGMILEEVTGQQLANLLQERIARPAGLRHTWFATEPGTKGPFLVGAAWTGTQAEDGLGWISLDHLNPELFSGAGAAVSTTEDLNSFTESLISGELLEPEVVQEMLRPRSTEQLDYGLGIYRVPDPCAAPDNEAFLYGHDGASFGTFSVALTSLDGSRQISIGVTGRDLTQLEQQYDLGELLVPMLLSTCGTQ